MRRIVVAVLATGLATSLAGGAAQATAKRATETITVSNTSATAVTSSTNLDPTHSYRLTVSGTVSDWCAASSCPPGDAATTAQPNVGVDGVWCYAKWRCSPPQAWQQLIVDGKGILDFAGVTADDVPYSSSHTYSVEFSGVSGPLSLGAADALAGSTSDNSGSFTVTLTDLGPSAASSAPTCRRNDVRHVASVGIAGSYGVDVHIDPALETRFPHLEKVLTQLLRTLRAPHLWGSFWDEKVPLSGCITTGGRYTFQQIAEALQGYLTDGRLTLEYRTGITQAGETTGRKTIILFERAGRDPAHGAKPIYDDYFLARTIFHELMHVFQYDKWNALARRTDYEGFPTATDAKLPTAFFDNQQYPDTGTNPYAPVPAP